MLSVQLWQKENSRSALNERLNGPEIIQTLPCHLYHLLRYRSHLQLPVQSLDCGPLNHLLMSPGTIQLHLRPLNHPLPVWLYPTVSVTLQLPLINHRLGRHLVQCVYELLHQHNYRPRSRQYNHPHLHPSHSLTIRRHGIFRRCRQCRAGTDGLWCLRVRTLGSSSIIGNVRTWLTECLGHCSTDSTLKLRWKEHSTMP